MQDFTSNLLIDELPKTLTVCGVEKEINSDFRTAILFELLMDDKGVPDDQKGMQAIQLFFPEMPRTKEEVRECIDGILWFYRGGKRQNEYMRNKEKKQAEKRRKGITDDAIYDFNYDDDYIYAAFMQQYGIDLNSVGYLHWWEFKALFKSLTNQTEFVKIMEYRGMEITSGMTQEQKSHYKKMKKIYALPKPQKEVDRMNAIEAALMGDGNVSSLL